MKLLLWSVGKPHESYAKHGIEEFSQRITRYFPSEWKLIAPARQAGTEEDIKKQEAKHILDALEKDDYLVLLDERGKQFTSEALATFIQTRANESTRNLIFLIGGAYGVDKSVQQRANYTWSLSPLVFPHQLVRLILAEQLYRACTILRNEKYHHS